MNTPEFFMDCQPPLSQLRSDRTPQAPGVNLVGQATGAVLPSTDTGIRYDISSPGVMITQVQNSFSGLPYAGSSVMDDIAQACHSVSSEFSNPDREPPITPETVKAGMSADVKGLAYNLQAAMPSAPAQTTAAAVDTSKTNGRG